MDWANERFVRLFTRDTPEWLCWVWQARALWPHLIRKADRSGVIANKLGARGLAALVGLPIEVVDAGLPDLLADGCLQTHQLGYVIPNYLEAQETPQSDKQRQRDSRERRRVVTKRDTESQNVTDRHALSRDVTTGHSGPDQTVPDPDPKEALSPAHDPAVPAQVQLPVPHQQHVPPVVQASNEVEKSEPRTPDRAGNPPPNGVPQSPTVHDSRTAPDEPADYDPEDPRARGRLAERIYRAVSDARISVAAELGLPAQLPFPPIAPSTSAGSFRDLRDRVREEGANAPVVCWRIVANLQAQAREDKSLEWLGEKAFREGSWRSAREWLPAAHRPRAGPKSSAARANTDPKIGRIEPPPASAFRGGIQKL